MSDDARTRYHLPTKVTGTDRLAGTMSHPARRHLEKAIVKGVAQAVRRAAPQPPPVIVDPDLFPIDETLREHPQVAEALSSPVMQRLFALRTLHDRRHPNQRLARFGPLLGDQLNDLQYVYDHLLTLSDLDWSVLEQRVEKYVPDRDWAETAGRLREFLDSTDRRSAVTDVIAEDTAISAAQARRDRARERTVPARLNGLEALYEAIKAVERQPDPGYHNPEMHYYRVQLVADRERKLEAARFRDVDDFDRAVGALREVVRDRAVEVALTTMRRSRRVLEQELNRYRAKDEVVRLATDVAELRRRPEVTDEDVVALAERYPLLQDEAALRGAVAIETTDILGEHLRQSAQAQLDNINGIRHELREDKEKVFTLNRAVDEAMADLGLPPNSLQVQLIHEGRAAPKSLTWAILDKVLLVLSFAWGPLAIVGYVARAIILIKTIHDSAERAANDRLKRAGAHAGKAVADAPVPSGQGWELFGLFLAATGVIPSVPGRLIPRGGNALPAARRLLGISEGRPVGFLPGTRIAETAPGELVIWHPDFPDEVFKLDATGLTRYTRSGRKATQTGFWPRTPGSGASALPSLPSLPLRTPGTKTLGSLGAMTRLRHATQVAETELRNRIFALVERLDKARGAYARFQPGGRLTALESRADGFTKYLYSLDDRLKYGLKGYQDPLRHKFPAGDEEAALAQRWVEGRMAAAERRVSELERLTGQVALATPAEQAMLDRYTQLIADLRAVQPVRVTPGMAEVPGRAAIVAEMEAIEQRAARAVQGEENAVVHLEPHVRDKRALLQQGQRGTLSGVRGTDQAARFMPGQLTGVTYNELVARLGPPRASVSLKGRSTFTWEFADGSSLRLDVPGKDVVRAFESGDVPHLARVGRDPVTGKDLHYNDNGIVVPAESTPAHIPLGKRQDLLNREQAGRRPRG